MKKHLDEAADMALLKKASTKKTPVKKVSKHLKEDIKESHKSIAEDKKLIETIKDKKYAKKNINKKRS